jgi:hypothetical protein
LADVDVELRLAYLDSEIDLEVERLHTWSFSWGSLYAAAGAVQLGAIGFTTDPGLHTTLAVGTISAAVGALSLFILPQRIIGPLRHVRTRWAEPDRCRLLADTERVFAEAARNERLGTSWVGHAGTVLINLGLLLILGLGYHRWTDGAISAGIGLAVGELNLWTQPTHLKGALERYHRLGSSAPPGASLALAPLEGNVSGMGFVFRF